MKLSKCIKFICAGIVSIIILCFIFTFYSLIPVHIPSLLKNTDYVWPPNSHWIKMTEGISFGKFDEFGFNNMKKGCGYQNTDILILGSSHMEATNVMQSKNVASILQNKLPNKKVYNMGISGHHIAKVFRYLPETLALFDNEPETIIIETSNLTFSEELVNQILTDSVDFTPSNDKGVIGKLQKLPFLRCIYHQLEGGLFDLLFPKRKNDNMNYISNNTIDTTDKTHYATLFDYLSDVLLQYNTHLIIFYHPSEVLNIDGSVTFIQDDNTALFKKYCDKSDKITFVNMTQPFYKMYEKDHRLPHGFSTGEIGKGHINSYGHECIANELYKVITEKL